jgi:fructokinase
MGRVGPAGSRSQLLVIGESLVDIIVDADGRVSEHPGGSPANVAYGLARLGNDVALLTQLGPDARGRAVTAHLTGAGVEVVNGARHGSRTATARAQLRADGSARYRFDLSWDLVDGLDLGAPQAIHTGSVGAVLAPGADHVLRYLRALRPSSILSYDPNIRSELMGDRHVVLAKVMALVALCDIVKVSDEDLRWLVPDQDPAAVARHWLERGPALVVVTRAAEGALALTGALPVSVPSRARTVVDTVGAGDSFMAGLLHALRSHGVLDVGLVEQGRRHRLATMRPETLAAVLATASAAAAVTVSRAGAALPDRAELAAELASGH